jgi:hypothetical protein
MVDREREEPIFTLSEAESVRAEVEPALIEAMELRKKMLELEHSLGSLASRIQRTGGLLVRYDEMLARRRECDRIAREVKTAIERIQATGCVVKDLDSGLIDFPARLNGEDVYWCWRLGEDRIRFWHRPDEGFAGRKPLFPHDSGPSGLVQ